MSVRYIGTYIPDDEGELDEEFDGVPEDEEEQGERQVQAGLGQHPGIRSATCFDWVQKIRF